MFYRRARRTGKAAGMRDACQFHDSLPRNTTAGAPRNKHLLTFLVINDEHMYTIIMPQVLKQEYRDLILKSALDEFFNHGYVVVIGNAM